MVFTVVVNHRVVLSGVSLKQAVQAAEAFTRLVPGATVQVGAR